MCNGQVQQNRSCMQGTCVCVVCVPSLDRFNVCHGVCVYVCKCIVHEYLRTRFHLCNKVYCRYGFVYVHNVLKKNTVNRSIYIRMHCVHKCVHSCTCTLCENSVRNNNPKSLQEVRRPCNNWIGMKMRRLARAMAKGKASCRERYMM